jgi:hypothetical protein
LRLFGRLINSVDKVCIHTCSTADINNAGCTIVFSGGSLFKSGLSGKHVKAHI